MVAVAIVSLASGCGNVDDASTADSTGVAATEPASGSAPDGGDDWCAAIGQLAAAQPAGSYSMEEHRASFLAYAEAADAAALVAVDDAEVLTKLAEASRVSAEDPGDPQQAELYGDIAGVLFEIASRAERECGITFD